MPDSNCICFKCKRSLIDIVESRGLLLTGCVNCNIWWNTSGGPVREYVSPATFLRAQLTRLQEQRLYRQPSSLGAESLEASADRSPQNARSFSALTKRDD